MADDMLTEILPQTQSETGSSTKPTRPDVSEQMRGFQDRWIKEHGIVDKDGVEARLNSVRGLLGNDSQDLVSMVQSGDPLQTANAMDKLGNKIYQTSPKTRATEAEAPAAQQAIPELTVTHSRLSEFPKIEIVSRNPYAEGLSSSRSTLVSGAIGRVADLYGYIHDGLIKGLKFVDVDDLMNRLRDPDQQPHAIKDAIKITNDIDEGLRR